MIELHYSPTPNCWKVAILLEETGLQYTVKRYDLFKGDHLVPTFRRINPNNKLPAIVDQDPADGGSGISVFESGAILFYLAEKTGQFLSRDVRPRTATMKWLAWQIAGLGPMMGQAGHFVRYVREPHPYSAQRYLNESRRLMHVLEYRLRESEYLSDEYSIADMAVWPWVRFLALLEIDVAEYPHVSRWSDVVGRRPAVQRVFTSTATAPDPAYLREKRVLTDEEWSNTYGERMLQAARLVPEDACAIEAKA